MEVKSEKVEVQQTVKRIRRTVTMTSEQVQEACIAYVKDQLGIEGPDDDVKVKCDLICFYNETFEEAEVHWLE